MRRGTEIKKRAIAYLKSAGCTDISVKWGGNHEQIRWKINGQKCMHVLPHNNPSDKNTGDLLMADLRREVNKNIRNQINIVENNPANEIVRISTTRTNDLSFRVAISNAVADRLTGNWSKNRIAIAFDDLNNRVILKGCQVGGLKPEKIKNSTNMPTSMAYAIIKKVPNWFAKQKHYVRKVEFEWGKSGSELYIPLPNEFLKIPFKESDYTLGAVLDDIKKDISIPCNKKLTSMSQIEQAVETGGGESISDGMTALQLVNEWLAEQQKEGKKIEVYTEDENGVTKIRVRLQVVTSIDL